MDPCEFVGRRTRSGSQEGLPKLSAAGGRAAAIGLAASLFAAQVASAQTAALSVELNKLEPQGSGCRAYVVVNNTGANQYDALKLDLVLFKPDGVIARHVRIDLAPLKASKRTVKLFDFNDLPCDGIGSLLINDVVECKTDAGPVEDCLAGIAVNSLTNVQLTK